MTRRPFAIITGATGGMGRWTVEDLARTHDVLALGRNQDVLNELGSLDNVTASMVDLTDLSSFPELLEGIERIDVLVHMAAVSIRHSITSATPADWQEQFLTNVFAPAELTRLAIPMVRAAQGTIIFIGSGASTKPASGHLVYTASKHALQGLADTLRIDEANTGVRISTIAPGPTNSGMMRSLQAAGNADFRPDHYIDPQSIAQAVRYVVDAPADTHITDVAVRPRVELHLRK